MDFSDWKIKINCNRRLVCRIYITATTRQRQRVNIMLMAAVVVIMSTQKSITIIMSLMDMGVAAGIIMDTPMQKILMMGHAIAPITMRITVNATMSIIMNMRGVHAPVVTIMTMASVNRLFFLLGHPFFGFQRWTAQWRRAISAPFWLALPVSIR